MDENNQKVSKYSSGVNINMRLDQLWKDSHDHSRNSRFKLWNIDLDCIWAELARDLKEKSKEEKEDFKKIKEEFEKFDERIKKHGVIMDSMNSGFRQISPDDIRARDEHYKILREKQIFLARLENRLGKGTSWEDEDDDDM